MGIYLFERNTTEGAGHEAGSSLWDDVSRALREIDWVETFHLRTDVRDDQLLATDVVFDEQWPDVRTSNPYQVSEVFHRLGLRTIANPALSRDQVSADDPLGIVEAGEEDEGLLLFDLDDEQA